MAMKLGISLPETDFGADPVALRDFTQLAEALGYHHLVVYGHSLIGEHRLRMSVVG